MFFFFVKYNKKKTSKTESPFVMSSLLSEYLEELKQYGPAYTQWADLEEALAEPLRGVASCVERCGQETEEHVQHLSDVLVPALHEYVLCAETVKVKHCLRWNFHLVDWKSFQSSAVCGFALEQFRPARNQNILLPKQSFRALTTDVVSEHNICEVLFQSRTCQSSSSLPAFPFFSPFKIYLLK